VLWKVSPHAHVTDLLGHAPARAGCRLCEAAAKVQVRDVQRIAVNWQGAISATRRRAAVALAAEPAVVLVSRWSRGGTCSKSSPRKRAWVSFTK
jgi:hypothetical protein